MIGVNPVTDDVENLTRVLDTVYGVIDKFNIPTGLRAGARHHPDRSDSSRRAGRTDFPEHLRQREGLKEFGVELAMLDEARAVGRSSTASPGKTACTLKPGRVCAVGWRELWCRPVTMEARNYGLARHYDPFW